MWLRDVVLLQSFIEHVSRTVTKLLHIAAPVMLFSKNIERMYIPTVNVYIETMQYCKQLDLFLCKCLRHFQKYSTLNYNL